MKKHKKLAKDVLFNLVDLQIKIEKLPPLSSVEKVKLEQSIAIDQLYYSSKIEGTTLTKEMIDKAIYGKEFQAT